MVHRHAAENMARARNADLLNKALVYGKPGYENPFFIALAAWWPEPSGDRDRRASWEYAGWDFTLVVCGAGLATLTGLYAAFGVIP